MAVGPRNAIRNSDRSPNRQRESSEATDFKVKRLRFNTPGGEDQAMPTGQASSGHAAHHHSALGGIDLRSSASEPPLPPTFITWSKKKEARKPCRPPAMGSARADRG